MPKPSSITRSILALSLGALASTAMAQRHYPVEHAEWRGPAASVRYDFARVLDARPVYERVAVGEPERVCWEEPVTYVEPSRYAHGPRRDAPEVLGGIIGGVIGNQFGSGSGRAAATVAGVALGSAVARDAERERYHQAYAPRYERTIHERRCEVRERVREERRIVGYEVSYDYQGSIGHLFSERHPGTEIRVRISVEPVD